MRAEVERPGWGPPFHQLVVDVGTSNDTPVIWLHHGEPEGVPLRFVRPDLNHGGTQGEMLALVRKAWGPCEIEIEVSVPGHACVAVIRLGARIQFARDTLGLALEAALLAAPLRTEGV